MGCAWWLPCCFFWIAANQEKCNCTGIPDWWWLYCMMDQNGQSCLTSNAICMNYCAILCAVDGRGRAAGCQRTPTQTLAHSAPRRARDGGRIPGLKKLGSGPRRVHPGRGRPRGSRREASPRPPRFPQPAGAPYAAFDPAPWMMMLAVLAASCRVLVDRWA